MNHAYYLHQMGLVQWHIRADRLQGSSLRLLANTVSQCTNCSLSKTRTQTVFSRGNSQAKLMIIGEAPGFYEDQQGLPFVGKAGGLLNKMLHSIGMSEHNVYIANVLKCRPPNNRDPLEEEVSHCSGYLVQQITLVKPSVILAVGRFAGQFLLRKTATLHAMRQRIHCYDTIPVIVSYHPAYLLRNPKDKKKAYIDLLRVKKCLENTQHLTPA